MRFLLKNLLSILLLATLGLGYIITCTETGLQISIRYIPQLFPGKLIIQSAHGKLFSKFSLHAISYQNKQHHIRIKSLDFAWNPAGLFQDKLIIENLVLNDTQITMKNTTNKPNEFNFNWLKHITLKQFIINKLSIQAEDASVEFDGMLTHTWNAKWKICVPQLKQFIPKSSGSLISSGNISGSQLRPAINALFQGKNLAFENKLFNKIEGKINLNLQPKTDSTLSLIAYGIKINNHVLPKLNAEIKGRITRKQETLLANLNITLAQDHKISALFELPAFSSFTNLDQSIRGNINFNSSHLVGLLTSFIPEIKKPNGILKGEFTLTGTLNQPIISGVLHLTDGSIAIPRLGIIFDKINLHAQHNPSQPMLFQGNFRSGQGNAQLHGTIDLTQPGIPVSINLQGENLLTTNLVEYKITTSPDLQLKLINRHLDIQGKVTIPHAEITPKNYGNTITLPNEIIFIDQISSNTSLPFDIAMQINLSLGKNIHIAYKELQTHLSGHVQITQSPNAPATATGELYAIKGTYHAYGQVLKIQDGRLIFTGGPVINPGLNIRAAKQVKTVLIGGSSSFDKNLDNTLKPVYAGTELITVGVQIEGAFDNPTISLFSNPASINQGDILSYLIFGYPQSQISDNQNRMLLSAASALNFGSKTKLSNITNKIQDKLGLKELNVESTEIFNPATGSVDSTTSVVVGKELAPNLYAHYSIGLFAPISILNLRYQMSKRFAIQSETSNIDSGADLLYSIERD